MGGMLPTFFHLLPSGPVPNNPVLPVVLYRRAVDVEGHREPAAVLEKLFTHHGWTGCWRNGVYPFHHYHSTAHEVLGCARGSARLLLGGPDGQEVVVEPGDVVVLPAGTGHCKLAGSADFLIVGAYPPGQEADLQRESADEALTRKIQNVPSPETDPVTGSGGALLHLWTSAFRGTARK